MKKLNLSVKESCFFLCEVGTIDTCLPEAEDATHKVRERLQSTRARGERSGHEGQPLTRISREMVSPESER